MGAPEIHDLTIKLIAPMSEFSHDFVKGMANRMAVSFHKYGLVADAVPDKVDALASAQQRVDLYRETGNTEALIDAANFLMMEFMHPSIPDAYFAATDSDGSPGRTTSSGIVTADHNTAL